MHNLSPRSHKRQSIDSRRNRLQADALAHEAFRLCLGLAGAILLMFLLFGCKVDKETTPQPSPSQQQCARNDLDCLENQY